jgi:hypothetical protein
VGPGHDDRVVWTAPAVERVDEPFVADERAMLEGFLDFARSTLLVKCSGLTGAQLVTRALPPSTLSLFGLVRHVTDVERTWCRRRFAAEAIESVYWRPDRPDAAFEEAEARGRNGTSPAWSPSGRRRAGSRGPAAGAHVRQRPLGTDAVALGVLPPDERVRPPQRARGPAPRTDRRKHRDLRRIAIATPRHSPARTH